jgi:phage terminase large subunit-like protein
MLTIEEKRIALKRHYLKEYFKKLAPHRYINPLPYQAGFSHSKKRYRAAFGGNRSGKTFYTAKTILDEIAEKENGIYLCATFSSISIKVQQKKFFDLMPKDGSFDGRFSIQRGFVNRVVTTDKGTIVYFMTYEQDREKFQGLDLDGIWLDEEPPEEIWKELKARIIDRNGHMWISMTPLNGMTYIKDEIVDNPDTDNIDYWFWPTAENTYIDQSAVQSIFGSYAEKEALTRSTGAFQNLTSGLTYYAFGEYNLLSDYDHSAKQTKDGRFKYERTRTLEISCDFNIEIMSWAVSQQIGSDDFVFDAIESIGYANTDHMCQMLRDRYPDHSDFSMVFYGDAAGAQRRPETTYTNWDIIHKHFPNAKIVYKNIKNIKDRVDSTNARLKSANQEVHCFISKSCTRLIKDLKRVTWELLLSQAQRNKNLENKMLTHPSDGLSYMFYAKYPVPGMIKTTTGLY